MMFDKIIGLCLIVSLVSLSTVASDQQDVCNLEHFNGDMKKIVCVCDKDNCGELKLSWPQEKGQAFVYESNRAGKRFALTDLNEVLPDSVKSSSPEPIEVNLDKQKQTILGWGGAFTDAFGFNLNSLSEDLQKSLLESYYGTNGLQYNFGRVPIGGTDFSTRPYSYDDQNKADFALKDWSLTEEDEKMKIPHIKQAMKIAKEQEGVDLKLFASPWSAPAWMKENNNLVRGHLKPNMLVYQAYSDYLIKFYDAYLKEGIRFWGATVQNEPVAANLPIYFFNSMQFTSVEMIKFISQYLGPALVGRGYTKDNFKLMIGDDSLGFVNKHVTEVMKNEEVQKYISGLAFHWYTSGMIVPYDHLTRLYNQVKDKIEFMMMSEACEGSMPNQSKVVPGSWKRAESYATDIIEDLSRNTNAWIDWNMALDMTGGPNWSGNKVDSPILVDAERKVFFKQPMYYSLAHFSRFFKPGSVVVDTETKSKIFSRGIKTIAAYNKETNHVTITILNKSNSPKTIDININTKDESSEKITLKSFNIDKRSIASVVVKL